MAADSSTTQLGATAGPAALESAGNASSAQPIIHDLVATLAEHRDTYNFGDSESQGA